MNKSVAAKEKSFGKKKDKRMKEEASHEQDLDSETDGLESFEEREEVIDCSRVEAISPPPSFSRNSTLITFSPELLKKGKEGRKEGEEGKKGKEGRKEGEEGKKGKEWRKEGEEGKGKGGSARTWDQLRMKISRKPKGDEEEASANTSESSFMLCFCLYS